MKPSHGLTGEDGLFEERNWTDIEPSRLSRNQSEAHWTVWENIIVRHVSFSTDHSLAGDDLEKLKQEFFKLTPKERASIARVMLKGAVEHARRKKKGTLRATRTN